jgi:hypothetical protein
MRRLVRSILALSLTVAPLQLALAQQAAPAAPGAAPAAPSAVPGAVTQPSKGYMLLRLGGFLPTGGDFKSAYDVGTGLDFEVGAGMFFTPAIAGEIAIGHFGVSGTKSVNGANTSGPWTNEIKTDLTVLSITGGVRAFLPLEKGSLQGLLGFGIYQGEAKLDSVVTRGGSPVGGASGSKTSSPVGFYLGGAYAYPVSPNFDIGLEAKFLLGPSFDYLDYNASLAAQAPVEGKVGLSGLRIFGAANYRF